MIVALPGLFSYLFFLLTFNTLKVENKKLINKNVMKWIFSHWPCYRSEGSRIGLRTAVLARCECNRVNMKTSI